MHSTICHFIKYNGYAFVIVQVVDATIYCACIVDAILICCSQLVAILLNMQSVLIIANNFKLIVISKTYSLYILETILKSGNIFCVIIVTLCFI